ncbi:MAG: hypothetical protein HN509_09625 [Halobacteriovoraceae bacterium]|jgi:hypothetical protein|nr:hypothetical protein [Halobacteriovoraceae bacterium]
MENSGNNDSTEQSRQDNLVLFPSSKSFPESDGLSDPLDELLNEFSHVSDEDLGLAPEPQTEPEPVQMRSIGEQVKWNELSPERLMGELKNQIEALQEAHERIEYYIADIETHLPSRR